MKYPNKFIDIFDQSKINVKIIIRNKSELDKKINNINNVNNLELKEDK